MVFAIMLAVTMLTPTVRLSVTRCEDIDELRHSAHGRFVTIQERSCASCS
jgi:hypothetical protein